MNQKGFAHILIIGIIVAIVAIGGYFVVAKKESPTSILPTSENPTPTPTSNSAPTPPTFSEQKQYFQTIGKGYYNGHVDRKDYVIKNISEWKNLWNIVYINMAPKPAFPSINFDNEMAVAVFQGNFPSGGYGIEIIKVLEKADLLEVTVKETSPSPDLTVTAALTQPFHIIKTKRVDKEVVFTR